VSLSLAHYDLRYGIHSRSFFGQALKPAEMPFLTVFLSYFAAALRLLVLMAFIWFFISSDFRCEKKTV